MNFFPVLPSKCNINCFCRDTIVCFLKIAFPKIFVFGSKLAIKWWNNVFHIQKPLLQFGHSMFVVVIIDIFMPLYEVIIPFQERFPLVETPFFVKNHQIVTHIQIFCKNNKKNY